MSMSGPLIRPSSIIACMPPRPSSAGWNTSLTVPASCGALLQDRGDTRQGGVVDVVAASMHQALVGAGEGQIAGLLDRQGVPVGADAQGLARATALDQADDAGFADADPMRNAQAGDFSADDAGGADFLEAQFGVGGDVTTDFDQMGLYLLDGGADGVGADVGHGGCLLYYRYA